MVIDKQLNSLKMLIAIPNAHCFKLHTNKRPSIQLPINPHFPIKISIRNTYINQTSEEPHSLKFSWKSKEKV